MSHNKAPSQAPSKIIKYGQIIDNQWLRVDQYDVVDSPPIVPFQSLLPLPAYLANPDCAEQLGVWLENDVDLQAVAPKIISAPVIAINFPTFMDGRGFSLARLLRQRYHYQGEIRAIGHIIRDQLCYLKRCGFNAFELSDDTDLQTAVVSLRDFSEFYQGAEDEPLALFKRR